MSAHVALGAVAALAGVAALSRRGSRAERWEEVSSDLFLESGANVTEPARIDAYTDDMEAYGGWGDFPPIHGGVSTVDEDDVEEYEEAAREGYAHELAWSRPIGREDIGREYAIIEDGHHRAYAANRVGAPIRVKIWDDPR